jgi:hypothetical protein
MIMGLLFTVIILAVCFGFGYLMNPTDSREYNYRTDELWEPPTYWTFDKNVPEVEEPIVVQATPLLSGDVEDIITENGRKFSI